MTEQEREKYLQRFIRIYDDKNIKSILQRSNKLTYSLERALGEIGEYKKYIPMNTTVHYHAEEPLLKYLDSKKDIVKFILDNKNHITIDHVDLYLLTN